VVEDEVGDEQEVQVLLVGEATVASLKLANSNMMGGWGAAVAQRKGNEKINKILRTRVHCPGKPLKHFSALKKSTF
jgi:hypothetical protein